MRDAQRELEIERETMRKEVDIARQEGEAEVAELKVMFMQENEALREQIEELEGTLDEYQGLIDEQANSIASLQMRLNEEVRVIGRQSEKKNEQIESMKAEYRPKPKSSERTYQTEDRPLQLPSTDRTSFSHRTWGTSEATFSLDRLGEEVGQRRREVEMKEQQSKDQQIERETAYIQKERLEMEVDRLKTELQTLQNDWIHSEEKRTQTELALKNEIKFLIGKLLKAKNRLVAESREFSGTLLKEASINVNRSRAAVSRSSTQRPISPLNVSAIPRAESPFIMCDVWKFD
jgi:hypothetical protein